MEMRSFWIGKRGPIGVRCLVSRGAVLAHFVECGCIVEQFLDGRRSRRAELAGVVGFVLDAIGGFLR